MGYGGKWQTAWREVWSLSAPSCKAGVYARCWLKTMGTGDERPLSELWIVRRPTSHWVICLALMLYILALLFLHYHPFSSSYLRKIHYMYCTYLPKY